MLYVDSPVGTGFSYSNSATALHTKDGDVSVDIASLIFQFFQRVFLKMFRLLTDTLVFPGLKYEKYQKHELVLGSIVWCFL